MRLLFFALLLIGGCGGGGGGGGDAAPPAPPPPSTAPSGTWLGTLEDSGSVMRNFSVTTSGSSITGILVSNASTGQTGTMTHQSGNIFSFTLNDGTRGGFFLDATQTHAVFLDDDFNFGVVQLGATALPAFSHTDLNGSWSGVAITTNFATFTSVPSSASCAVPTCTVVDSGVTTTATFTVSNFDSFDGPNFGRWLGTYMASDNTNGSIRAFLSVDKQFAGGFSCPAVVAVPTPVDCEFTAWRR